MKASAQASWNCYRVNMNLLFSVISVLIGESVFLIHCIHYYNLILYNWFYLFGNSKIDDLLRYEFRSIGMFQPVRKRDFGCWFYDLSPFFLHLRKKKHNNKNMSNILTQRPKLYWKMFKKCFIQSWNEFPTRSSMMVFCESSETINNNMKNKAKHEKCRKL